MASFASFTADSQRIERPSSVDISISLDWHDTGLATQDYGVDLPRSAWVIITASRTGLSIPQGTIGPTNTPGARRQLVRHRHYRSQLLAGLALGPKSCFSLSSRPALPCRA